MKLSHRNRGSLLLAKTGKKQAEIAARIGASRTAVVYWLSGERVPVLEMRAVLQKAFKIPIYAWDEPIVTPKQPKKKIAAGAPELAAAEPIAAPPAPLVINGEFSVRARALRLDAKVHELLERVTDDKETTDLEKFKCLNSAAATLNLLGKLTGQTQDVNEARILRLPAFQRIQEGLIRVLSSWPDALRAVGEELQRMGVES